MARRDYGFVRSYASLGRDLDDLMALMGAGYSGALFAYDDPYLAQAINDARNAGIPYGIWADPHGRNPQQFAQLMAGLYQQYNPSLLVPDIEFIGKGYQGSPGWEYNRQLANLWQQYLPGVRTAVTVMPNQNDFNYGAWNQLGVEWLPQAYGANPNTDVFNPNDVVQTLINNGIDPSLISPVLGPGHQQGYGGAALWTVDDFTPAGRPIPKAQGPETRQQATGGRVAPTSGTRRGPQLSQSQAQVAAQGLRWGGKVYANPRDFKQYLQQRGLSYANWVAEHPFAAAGLRERSVNNARTRPQ